MGRKRVIYWIPRHRTTGRRRQLSQSSGTPYHTQDYRRDTVMRKANAFAANPAPIPTTIKIDFTKPGSAGVTSTRSLRSSPLGVRISSNSTAVTPGSLRRRSLHRQPGLTFKRVVDRHCQNGTSPPGLTPPGSSQRTMPRCGQQWSNARRIGRRCRVRRPLWPP